MRPDSPPRPRRARLPPARTRGQYLRGRGRGRGRGARPAAAGSTGTTLSWPAPAGVRLPPRCSRRSPSARPRPQPRPRAAHVVALSFNNNFIEAVEPAGRGVGPVPMAMDATGLREAQEFGRQRHARGSLVLPRGHDFIPISAPNLGPSL